MTLQESLVWLRERCPPEYYETREFWALEDLINIIYVEGKEITDRIIPEIDVEKMKK